MAAISWVVAGQRILLDPGHGGEDPGKVGVGGSFEKDINLQVAIKVRSLLAQGGAGVIMTREQDNSLVRRKRPFGSGSRRIFPAAWRWLRRRRPRFMFPFTAIPSLKALLWEHRFFMRLRFPAAGNWQKASSAV